MSGRGVNSRNEAFEFATRARQNLEFIEAAASRGDASEVHVVTQLTLSLLGILVFPKEKLLLGEIESTPLADLTKGGWPAWLVTRDEAGKPTDTLGRLLRHVRNAVAHGRITFSSDSPRMQDVSLLVEDKRKREDPAPYWCAEISAMNLKGFCERFLDLIRERTG